MCNLRWRGHILKQIKAVKRGCHGTTWSCQEILLQRLLDLALSSPQKNKYYTYIYIYICWYSIYIYIYMYLIKYLYIYLCLLLFLFHQNSKSGKFKQFLKHEEGVKRKGSRAPSHAFPKVPLLFLYWLKILRKILAYLATCKSNQASLADILRHRVCLVPLELGGPWTTSVVPGHHVHLIQHKVCLVPLELGGLAYS